MGVNILLGIHKQISWLLLTNQQMIYYQGSKPVYFDHIAFIEGHYLHLLGILELHDTS